MYRNGDQIDLHETPEHCGQPMQTWAGTKGAYEVACVEDDYVLDTDHNGNIIGAPRKS